VLSAQVKDQMKTLISTGFIGHGLQEGDIVVIISDGSRLKRIKRLLVRPRLQVVGSSTSTTFSLVERRMTWREWRRAMQSAIFG